MLIITITIIAIIAIIFIIVWSGVSLGQVLRTQIKASATAFQSLSEILIITFIITLIITLTITLIITINFIIVTTVAVLITIVDSSF